MLAEAIDLLAADRGGWFVDATVGAGGHAAAILAASPDSRLLALDRDREIVPHAERRLAPFGDRYRFAHGSFADLADLVAASDVGPIVGVLADLGVSSLQLDRGERGFSFRLEGPLDMRMDRDRGISAADVVNTYSEVDLERIFKRYGEERQGRRIARAIAEERASAPLDTTTDLRELVYRAKRTRPGRREGRVDPATRVFQALRIEVNRELEGLERLLDQAVSLLEREGRLVVISYHSLEDRIVKHSLRDLALGEVDAVTGRPRAETQLIEVLTKKPVRPTAAEVEANPRARSARLRAARRI